MWYWNQTNFEGLEAIATIMFQEPDLHLYAQYCEWRAKGLRKNALKAISEFTNNAVLWDFEKRKGFTDSLLTLQRSNTGIHQLIPFPVSNKIFEPTLKEWVQLYPNDVKANRWFGITFQNIEALEKAANTDPKEIIARYTIIDWLGNQLQFATHHLPEHFIGTPTELDRIIKKVDELLKQLPESDNQKQLVAEHSQQVQLINDWKTFLVEGHSNFKLWCIENEKSYSWTKAYYYNT